MLLKVCASLLRALHAIGCDMEQCGFLKQHLLGSSCAGLDAVCPDGYLLLGSYWCGASPLAGGQAGKVQVLQGHHECERPTASVWTAGMSCDSAAQLFVMLQAVYCQPTPALLLCMHTFPLLEFMPCKLKL